MMTLNQAVVAAQNTPTGTPEYHAACYLCHLRGIEAGGMVFGIPLQNWQRVIAEQLLEQSLRDAMMGKW